MFKNFINTLRRYSVSSLLNIIGLSVAFAAFMVIMIHVRYELTFDRFHSKGDRIFKVELAYGSGGGQTVVARALVNTLGESSPLIESYTLIGMSFKKTYFTVEKNGSKVGFSDNIESLYPSIADMFDFKMVEGSILSLDEPAKVILPASKAKLYFGEGSALGKILKGAGDKFWEVGGVYEDFPGNTQLNNSIYHKISDRDGRDGDGNDSWTQHNYFMYVTLVPGATPEQVLADYAKVVDLKEKVGDYVKDPHLLFTPIGDLYFAKRDFVGDYLVKHGDKTTNDVMISIAILILLIAAINFVNFSTSLAPLRMKSINVQKVLGSLDLTLRLRLIFEAVALCIISFSISIIIVYLLSVSSLNDIILNGISIQSSGLIIAFTAVVSVILGFMAGIYPAFYTTKFPPVMALKGSFAMSPRGRALRTFLIGFQFIVSTSLIIAAIFLQLQNSYMRHMNTGVDRENTAIIELGGALANNTNFENELRTNPLIRDVAYSQFNIGGDNMAQGWGKEINGKIVMFDALMVSWNFPEVMGLDIVEGESFRESDEKKDTVTYIFNETAVKQHNIKMGDALAEGRIAGFVKDFNFKSLHYQITPMALVLMPPQWRSLPVIYVKIMGDPFDAVDYIRQTATAIDPAYPLNVQFYDQTFDNLYQKERKSTGLITLFSILAVIISLVGVFGLVIFETQYRRKEIGLRKINGATVGVILALFNVKFVRLVVVCFILAMPIAWYGVNEWLAGFAYRTPMYWWVFVMALVIVLVITVMTVTIQSWRAATENPVKSLKSE